MKLQSPSAGREKLPNHLVINAEAHRGPAAGAHLAALTASVGVSLAGDTHPGEKQASENIWIALFKYLVHPEMAAASQSWRGSVCL